MVVLYANTGLVTMTGMRGTGAMVKATSITRTHARTDTYHLHPRWQRREPLRLQHRQPSHPQPPRPARQMEHREFRPGGATPCRQA